MDQQQEHRLQRVEEVVSDIKADLASVSTQIALGFEAVNEKLAKLGDLPPRVIALEIINTRRSYRIRAAGKAVLGVLGPIVAAVILFLFGIHK